MPIIRPAEPVITPADRSNSPPIISSATTTAGMPIVEATSVQLAMPSSLQEQRVLRPEEDRDDDRGQQRADLGAAQEPRHRADLRQPLVAGRAGGGARPAAGRRSTPPCGCHVSLLVRRGGRPAAVEPAARSLLAGACLGQLLDRRGVGLVDEARAGEDRLAAADGVGVVSCTASGTRSAGSPAGTAAGRPRTATSPALMSLMTSGLRSNVASFASELAPLIAVTAAAAMSGLSAMTRVEGLVGLQLGLDLRLRRRDVRGALDLQVGHRRRRSPS